MSFVMVALDLQYMESIGALVKMLENCPICNCDEKVRVGWHRGKMLWDQWACGHVYEYPSIEAEKPNQQCAWMDGFSPIEPCTLRTTDRAA